MNILFLHGKESGPGGTKPKYLAEHGFTVINPALPADDFDEAVRIAQAAFNEHAPDVVVGSSRGGAVAMNINSHGAGLVLLCPAWKKWGVAKTVQPRTVVIHSSMDDIIPFTESEALVANSPDAVLVEIGVDHRLSTPEALAAMLDAVRWVAASQTTTRGTGDASKPHDEEMVGRHPFIRALATNAAKRTTRRFIRAMQKLTDCKISGDDSGLLNLWDEICAQAQFDQFEAWEAYEETGKATLDGLVAELSEHEQRALWLQTESGWDWDYDTRDANIPCPICTDDIVNYVWSEYIMNEAGRWSNSRIRAYLERAGSVD